jgi:MFS family permease
MAASVPSTQSARRVPLAALFAANTVSLTGSVLTALAVPWFVLQTTNSPTKTGITAFFEFLASVVAAFFGGAVVDRIGYKRASVIADLTSGACVALVPLLYYTVGLQFWELQALVFLGTFCNMPGTTARSALVPDLAAPAGMRLERANAAMQAIQRGATLVGAPLAGVLIASLGASRLLWLDAATFLFSAVVIGLFVPRPAPKVEAKDGEVRSGYFAELREGLRFIFADRLVLAIVLTVMVTNFVDTPFSSVELPVFAKQQYDDPRVVGFALAAFGGGSLLGAVLYGWLGHRIPRRPIFLGLFTLCGLRFFALAFLPPLPVILGTLAVTGFASGPINPILGTLGQERAPAHMRGRVFGAITAGAWSAIPLGVLAAGVLIDRVGLRAVFLGSGLLYLATMLALTLSPASREMDAPQAVTAGFDPAPDSEPTLASSGMGD